MGMEKQLLCSGEEWPLPMEADMAANRCRSVRIGGVVTSVRLENLFWTVLGEMAASRGVSMSLLINQLCAVGQTRQSDIHNKASLLRLACLQFLRTGIPPAPAFRGSSGASARDGSRATAPGAPP
jgi:predicted DNA-binding ribbon-helix-helix protein